MKLKLALLDSDTQYLQRLVMVFNDKYADELEVYSFTSADFAAEAVRDNKIQLFLADEAFEIAAKELPKGCGFAYLTQDSAVETIKGQKAICKFQRAETLFRQLLDLYADVADPQYVFKGKSGNTSLLWFSSPCGGVGTSSLAAAKAIHDALAGLKALYLNLTCFGGADLFFQADGKDFGDVIYALKSKKNNLLLKLESCLNRDPATGVYFYGQPKIALDMLELTADDREMLLEELLSSGMFDKIIVDADFSFRADGLLSARVADKWIWCTDGSASANAKIARAYKALTILEETAENSLQASVTVLGNKWTSYSVCPEESVPKLAGTAALVQNQSPAACARILAGLTVFDVL